MVKVVSRLRGEGSICGAFLSGVWMVLVGEGCGSEGGRRVFSQRRRRSQDSRAERWEGGRAGMGRERVEMLCGTVSYLLP